MAPYAAERAEEVEGSEVNLPVLKGPQCDNKPLKISYVNVVLFGYWHAAAVYGAYLAVTSASWITIIFSLVLLECSLLGVLAGAHRLWSHRSYKAKLPLQILLMIFNTLSGQYTAYNWARDHRLHHKYSDTDADPHNATRGFFYSHIGWLLVVKHPEVKRRGATIDMSDLLSNPVIVFQRKYAAIWFTIVCYVIPTVIPMYFWNESLTNAWHLNILRFILCLNSTSLINSAAHKWGNKPYDKHIMPTQSTITNLSTLGEGFHNYHHSFPMDYRAAEFGNETLNVTSKFIAFFAWLGWAYDLKTVDRRMIGRRVERTGDVLNILNAGHQSIPSVVCFESGTAAVTVFCVVFPSMSR